MTRRDHHDLEFDDRGNSATIGGGLGMETPALTVTSSTISGNTAIDYGGGIITGEKTVFVNVVIAGNT